MKSVILNEGFLNPHVGWYPIDEYAVRLSSYLDAPLFSPVPSVNHKILRRLPDFFKKHIQSDLPSADVLIVIARNPGDLDVIETVSNLSKRYGRVCGWVSDSYFHSGFSASVKKYHHISVTDDLDADFLKKSFGVSSSTVRQGVDTLSLWPKKKVERSIDLLGFGRLPVNIHRLLQLEYHKSENSFLYLHSPIGSLTGESISIERHMLIKVLQRTRFALAFHMYCNPELRRPMSMMVTSRWLESLAAGCIVIGKKPKSEMSDNMLFWPNCTIELPDEDRDAMIAINQLLSSDDSIFEKQRAINIKFMMNHHDIRSRLYDLLNSFSVPIPNALLHDLSLLRSEANVF